ncbi:MAG TPA: hypothetical protein VHG09_13555, partial [Longimicrobiales bacterium]|nr:hypothetical protein [Longimicrobiales bacterium]
MMTMHPGSDVLLAHADGELPNDDDCEVVRHLADCMECSAAVARLRADAVTFAGALHTLDEAEPGRWAAEYEAGSADTALHQEIETAHAALHQEIETAHAVRHQEIEATHATRDEPALLPLRSRSVRAIPSRPRWSDGLRWAAGILLVAGATVSGAVVGARILSDRVVGTAPVAEPATVQPGVAAVMVSPVAGRVVVAVSGAGAESRLFVSFADRTDASLSVESTGSPRFRAVDGGVDLDLAGASAVVRLTLPQSLQGASVTAEGISVATVQDGEVLPAA